MIGDIETLLLWGRAYARRAITNIKIIIIIMIQVQLLSGQHDISLMYYRQNVPFRECSRICII